MSRKPLEPQPVPHPVFLDRHGEPWYRWKDTLVRPSVADLYHERKRLTLPELAAEYWYFDMADFDYPGGDPDDITEEQWSALCKRQQDARKALHRFATLPHAADKDYQ